MHDGGVCVVDGVVLIPRDPNNARKRNVEPMPAWGRNEHGVWIRCRCGLPMSIDHEIAADGAVTPSLWHDVPECGWHIHGKLEDWQA